MRAVDNFLTTTEVAERLGVTPGRVRQLVADGVLPVTKFGPVNMVKEGDLKLVQDRPGRGRPSTKKASKKGGKK